MDHLKPLNQSAMLPRLRATQHIADQQGCQFVAESPTFAYRDAQRGPNYIQR